MYNIDSRTDFVVLCTANGCNGCHETFDSYSCEVILAVSDIMMRRDHQLYKAWQPSEYKTPSTVADA